MTEIVQFETGHGPVLVEGRERQRGHRADGAQPLGVLLADKHLDEALQAARPAIRAVLDTLRELAPEEHVVEFGIKLDANAGVVVAKAAAEGHFTVKITWRRDTTEG